MANSQAMATSFKGEILSGIHALGTTVARGGTGADTVKAALYLAMREAGMTNVQLARRIGCDEKEVRRMLDPRHPTKLPRIKEALEVFGKRLVVSVEQAA